MDACKSHTNKVKSNFSLMVFSDSNASIGADLSDLLPRQIGPHLTVKESSRNGELLVEFLSDHDLRVENSFFTKKQN